MKTIHDLVTQWAEEREVDLVPHPEGLAFQVTGEQGVFSLVLFPQEEHRLLVTTALFSLFVPEGKRQGLLEPLIQVNSNLSWGSFCLRMDSGELYFLQSQMLPKEGEALEILDACLSASVQVMDHHLPILANLCAQ